MEIVKQDVTVQTGSEKMPCYVARPASGGPYPGLVVVMEAFGLMSGRELLHVRWGGCQNPLPTNL